MTAHPTNRESKRARKIGYVVGFMVNSIMLFIVNVRPGWRQLSFLTEDFAGILWLINLSMVSSATANLIYLWYDRPGSSRSARSAYPRSGWAPQSACCGSSRSTSLRTRSTGRR